MGLKVGIVGLPNVGKSTIFNALTKTMNAHVANYPFCTIDPNRAVVPVRDPRVDKIAEMVNPQRVQYSTVEFVDIAGLVKGASRGDGLGNKFLSNIRECDSILHVVRCFDDEDVTHVEGRVNPVEDCTLIETELILSDLQTLEGKIHKLSSQSKSSCKKAEVLEVATKLKEYLEVGMPVRSFPNLDRDEFRDLNAELRFLSHKEVIYCANTDEDSLVNCENPYISDLREYASAKRAEFVVICAKLEAEMLGMSDSEREQYLSETRLGCGLDQVVRAGFRKLGLINYFTVGEKEVRAWSISRGQTAPKAAGVIHGDFEKGFIRAECISYDDFIRCGSMLKAKEAGLIRLEGKGYIVNDGDIMHFRFAPQSR